MNHSQPPPKITGFFEDIWLDILSWVPLAEILALRQTCKRLQQITGLRAVWINLARQYIWDKGLPWPPYASPVSSLPTSSLVHLVSRAIVLESVWDLKEEPRARSARCLLYPTGSISWLELFRSRWLIVGSTEGSISLWDLQSSLTAEIIRYQGLPGYAESGILWSPSEGTLIMAVNTNLSHSRFFSMNLPHLGERIGKGFDASNFVELASIDGYSRILTATGHLIGFSRSVDYNQPFVVDYRTRGAVCLERMPSTSKVQSCISMGINEDLVVVAKDWCLELYPANLVRRLVTPHDAHAPSLYVIPPCCSIGYPGGQMAWRINILPQQTPLDASSTDSACTISMAISNELGVAHLSLHYTGLAGAAEHGSISSGINNPSGEHVMGDPAFELVLDKGSPWATRKYVKHVNVFEWGTSCHRFVYPNSDQECIMGGVFTDTTSDSGYCAGPKVDVLWELPRFNTEDLPRLGRFDEGTGTIALAMMSGRIWILDMARFDHNEENWARYETVQLPLTGNLKTYDGEMDADAGWVLVSRLVEGVDPFVPPPGWPTGTPTRYTRHAAETAAEISHQWCLITPERIPDGWTNDWCENESLYRWDGYYGGIESELKEVFHIPGKPKLLLFKDLGYTKHLIEVDGEFFIRSWEDFELYLYQIGGSPDLNEVLAFLRGDLDLPLYSWGAGDRAASLSLAMWMEVLRKARPEILPNEEEEDPVVDSY